VNKSDGLVDVKKRHFEIEPQEALCKNEGRGETYRVHSSQAGHGDNGGGSRGNVGGHCVAKRGWNKS
jgi:hypothetical protein